MSKFPKKFDNREQLLDWYKQHKWFHERLAMLVSNYMEWQVKKYFKSIKLPVIAHVRHREKSLQSLSRNLMREGYYGNFPLKFEKVGDLAAVRVVFYFASDVEDFWRAGEQLFRIWFGVHTTDSSQSNDGTRSRNWQGIDESYRGWQFTLRVDADTDFFRALTEMDQHFLRGLFCEVQLRTTLQDAWAVTSHDIRYKINPAARTPREERINRAFKTLADRLTDGDETLVGLKVDYQINVEEVPDDRPAAVNYLWNYDASQSANSIAINGVSYPYELLDDGNQYSHAITIVTSTTVFNVDQAVWEVASVKNFKDSMWKLLTNTEAQFVVAISYDSMVVRAKKWDAESRTLSVELAAYSDQVVTNHKRAQGKCIPGDVSERTVRDLAMQGQSFLSFEESPLSNTIGVCCVLRTSDERWVIALRSPSVAFDPGTWGCPASGALNWVELGHWESRDFNGWFRHGIVREIEEELGYTASDSSVHYLGLAREFGRLGKPQVFFWVDAEIKCDDLLAKFKTYRKTDAEFDRLEFLNEEQALDLVSSDELRVNSLGLEANIGEELRFNLALALQQ